MATSKKTVKVKKAIAPAKKTAVKKPAPRPSLSEAKQLMPRRDVGATLPAKMSTGISAEERMETSKKTPVSKPEQRKTERPYFYANGKRKTSVALVRLYTNGKGLVTVNEKTLEHYFPVFTDQDKILAPLRVTNQQKTFDVSARVQGGGIHSQAEAVRHGISKALLEYSAELRTALKPLGFLTRDPRVKERKKYGLHRARRAPQWQKR